MAEKRNCSICGRHYVLCTTSGISDDWRPDCTCESDSASAAEQRELIKRARGPLDASFAALVDQGEMVGARLARRRRELGLSQVELGALVGRSESWVSQVERGVRRIDRLSVLQKLRDVLGDPK
jgi:ribosome-binding protein aMBF1 (putative translation factor)